MTSIATIDIGTNSVLLSIFQTGTELLPPSGTPKELIPIREEATVTRLGEGVDETHALSPSAVERTLSCLKGYAQLIQQNAVSTLKVVGTSALRDARGSGSFLALAESILGQPIEIISGSREAELTFRGALSGLAIKQDVFVFDIGGGSTELIIGNASSGEIHFSVSMDIGSVRLNERVRPKNPPEAQDIAAFEQIIRAALAKVEFSPRSGMTGVGVAGTMTTLSALSLNLSHYDPAKVHGSTYTYLALHAQQKSLQAMSLEQRLALPCLSRGRADVIVAGAIIATEILRWAQLDSIFVSDRGVRYGLAGEMLSKI